MLSEPVCGSCHGVCGKEPGVCYVKNVMWCQQCEKWQPKSEWSPAQWQSLQCVLLDLRRNCCSVCSPDWWCPQDVVLTPSPAWAQKLLVVLQVDSVDALIQRTYRIAKLGQKLNLDEFIVYWMRNLGRQCRKDWSHFGALRHRQGLDGVLHTKGYWADIVSGQKYFDPGNHVYSCAFHLAFPDIMDKTRQRWNEKTVGDIFEGLLAVKCLDDYAAVRKMKGHPRFPPQSSAARIAAWIEELVTLVWAVCLIHPVDDSPTQWASRWHEATWC